jgi:hypothetical protein
MTKNQFTEKKLLHLLEARFVPWPQGERDWALAHIPRMQPGDIGLLDRGFAAYE